MMEYIAIGDSGLRASRVGLGTWSIGGWMWGGTEEKEAIATIHAALDDGINLLDTAAVYGYGNSEEIVGKALVGGRRDKAIVATKVTLDWTDDGKVFRNGTKARIEKRSRIRYAACRPTSLTSIKFTGPIRLPRSKKPPGP